MRSENRSMVLTSSVCRQRAGGKSGTSRINPQMKWVVCWRWSRCMRLFSCKPEDVMFAQESMRERYVFTDVQLRGYYQILCVLNEWERAAGLLLYQNGRWRSWKCCAKAPGYLGFDCTHINAVKAEGDGDRDFRFFLKAAACRTYVKASDWGWQIGQWACVIHCVNCTNAIKSRAVY